MIVGYAVAQALPILAAPLLTRLYSPEAIGIQSVFMSWSAILAVVATLRLDLAVVLAPNRSQASQTILLGGWLTLMAATAITLAAAVHAFLPGLEVQGGRLWVWLLPLMVAAVAITQLAGALLVWSKRFAPVSGAQVGNQGVYLCIAAAWGFASGSGAGLLVAKVVGQLTAAMLVVLAARRSFARPVRPAVSAGRKLWRRCRPFVLFNAPYSLVGSVGREVPIFAFAAFGATSAVGFYALARSIIGVPTALLSSSLSQVFYREAAESRGSEGFQRLVYALLRVTAWGPAPAFGFLVVWGDVAFRTVFGDAWDTAGVFAGAMSIAAWLGIQSSWPDRIYEAHGKQSVSFVIQICWDGIAFTAVFLAVWSGASPVLTVLIFAIVNSLFHLTYLVGIFRVARIRLSILLSTLGGGMLTLAASAVALVAIRYSGLSLVPGMLLSFAIAGLACAGAGGWSYLRLRKETAVG